MYNNHIRMYIRVSIEIGLAYHLLEVRKPKIGHAGLGWSPQPKAGMATVHQTHVIGYRYA